MRRKWRLPLHGSGHPPKHALVDREDFIRLSKHKWYLTKGGYAVRSSKGAPPVYLHTEIIQCAEGFVIDHINRDRLDCRSENLRLVTDSQSMWNRGIYRNNSSGYKGVHNNEANNKLNPWEARIAAHNKRYHLGWFRTAEEAARAYDAAAKRLHGPYAVLNFPDDF